MNNTNACEIEMEDKRDEKHEVFGFGLFKAIGLTVWFGRSFEKI